MEKIKQELKHHVLNVSTFLLIVIYGVLQLALYLSTTGTFVLHPLLITKIEVFSLVLITFFVINLILRLSVNRISALFDEDEEKIFYSKIYMWSFYLLGVIFLLFQFGVSLSNLTLSMGLMATGFAFAIRDVLLSFFSWIILLRKRPFRIGDYIRIGDDEGKVIHIGTFYVLIDKTPDFPEDYTRIPNKLFLEKSITNYGKHFLHEFLRFQLKGIPSQHPAMVKELKAAILSRLEQKEHLSIYTDLKDDKIYLMVEYRVSFKEKRSTRSDVISLVYQKYQESMVTASA